MKLYFKFNFFTTLIFFFFVINFCYSEEVEEEFLSRKAQNTFQKNDSINLDTSKDSGLYIYFFRSIIILSIILVIIYLLKYLVYKKVNKGIKSLDYTSSFHLGKIPLSDGAFLEFVEILNEVYVILIHAKTAQCIKVMESSKDLRDFLLMFKGDTETMYMDRFLDYFNYYFKQKK